MSSEIKANSIQDKTGTRVLASDSGSAWSWGANVPKGSVIEQFMSPCDGSSITVQSGTYTVQNVTTAQNCPNGSWDDVTGSTIDYTPPTGTQTVIYSFNLHYTYNDDAYPLGSFALYLDNDSGTPTEVTNFRTEVAGADYIEGKVHLVWPFHIGGSDNDATGRRDTWTSARTIKLQCREYASVNEFQLHTTQNWEATGTNQFSQPVIGITALA